jgi:hypothetical protein
MNITEWMQEHRDFVEWWKEHRDSATPGAGGQATLFSVEAWASTLPLRIQRMGVASEDIAAMRAEQRRPGFDCGAQRFGLEFGLSFWAHDALRARAAANQSLGDDRRVADGGRSKAYEQKRRAIAGPARPAQGDNREGQCPLQAMKKTNPGYLRYDIEPPRPPPDETPEQRIKRILKAIPSGAFMDPQHLVVTLRRAVRRENQP